MEPINEKEIKDIVQRVVAQSLGDRKLPFMMEKDSSEAETNSKRLEPLGTSGREVAIGADHGGFELKEILKKHLGEHGFQIIDCGTNDKTSVDYPDFAQKVAELVAGGKAWRGVMIDGAGIGSCMTANKVPGVRAAMCYDYATAVNSREHNDANVLTLGAGLIGINQAKLIMDTWLKTEFGGDRHARRVDKISAVEKLYAKGSN